ncbi:hypothetical protein V8C40DRAFT_257043 [Trichoderma camerunense]
MWCLEGEIGQDNVHWCGPTIGDPFCASHQGCDEKREKKKSERDKERPPRRRICFWGTYVYVYAAHSLTHSLNRAPLTHRLFFLFFFFSLLLSSRLLPC